MLHDGRTRVQVPRHLREKLYLKSGGVCQNGCGTAIELDTFHVSHLRSHAHGGALVEANLEAWCSRCNFTQGSDDVRDTRTQPREWQLEALDPTVGRIINDGAATISAAPGAGKTIFAGLVYETLHEADVVDRMVVLTPRRTLVDQWAKALRTARHLELKRDSAVERPGQDGVVSTYQSLNTLDVLNNHREQAAKARTLLVLDEVHHVGERVGGIPQKWAHRVAALAGGIGDVRVAGVLNLSGTLWRSKPAERISTVRYRTTEDNRLESLVDFDLPAERLILAGELRPIDLYRLDARVRMNDMAQLEVIDSNMADLDERPARAAIRAAVRLPEWRAGFVRAVLDRLEHAHRALDGYHTKALIVAGRQEDARAFQTEINLQMTQRGLQPLAEVATSDEDEPLRVLEDFRRQQRVGVLCTVDMAGEGYDCPDIAVIGYATDKLTTMYVRQVVARAMRVTGRERLLGRIIPAAVVLPDVALLVETMVSYLAKFTHEVVIPDETETAGDGYYGPDGVNGPRFARFVIDDITPGAETTTVSESDGNVYNFDRELVDQMARRLESLHVPSVYAPRVLAANRQTVGDLLAAQPFDASTPPPGEPEERFDTIEDRCRLLQRKLHGREGWWANEGNPAVPVAKFAAEANHTAGLPTRNGRETATAAQLERALEHEDWVIAKWQAQASTTKRNPR